MNLKHLLAVAKFSTDQTFFLVALLDRLAAFEASHNSHQHQLTDWDPEDGSYQLETSEPPSNPFQPEETPDTKTPGA